MEKGRVVNRPLIGLVGKPSSRSSEGTREMEAEAGPRTQPRLRPGDEVLGSTESWREAACDGDICSG